GYAAFDLAIGCDAAGPVAPRAGHGLPASARSEDLRATARLAEAPQARRRQAVPHVSATNHSAENDVLQLTVNDEGTFDVMDKATGHTYRGVGLLEDGGDVG